MKKIGRFIVIEGIDNCGKTTQSTLLKKYLEDLKYKVILTREPGGTVVGEEIREVLLKVREKLMDPLTQTLLFFAARKEFINEIVTPALLENKIVITDRFSASTYVYQGFVQGVGKKFIDILQKNIVAKVSPDVYIILDITPKESFKRGKNTNRKGQDLIYEKQGLKFMKNLRQGYIEYAKNDKSAIVISAMKSEEVTHKKIIKALKQKGII